MQLIIVRGLPGSGKSTLGRQITDALNADGQKAHALETDDFFKSTNGVVESYDFDKRYLGAAHDETFGRTMRYMRNGYTTVVCNTFSTRREIERYVRGASRCGLKFQLSVIHCTGDFKSVHNVPKAAIDRMASRWETWSGETEYRGRK